MRLFYCYFRLGFTRLEKIIMEGSIGLTQDLRIQFQLSLLGSFSSYGHHFDFMALTFLHSFRFVLPCVMKCLLFIFMDLLLPLLSFFMIAFVWAISHRLFCFALKMWCLQHTLIQPLLPYSLSLSLIIHVWAMHFSNAKVKNTAIFQFLTTVLTSSLCPQRQR